MEQLKEEYKNYSSKGLRKDIKLFFGVKATQQENDIKSGLAQVYACSYRRVNINSIQFEISGTVDKDGIKKFYTNIKKVI